MLIVLILYGPVAPSKPVLYVACLKKLILLNHVFEIFHHGGQYGL
jgi:hypothetical protein